MFDSGFFDADTTGIDIADSVQPGRETCHEQKMRVPLAVEPRRNPHTELMTARTILQ